jgi:hypothetical protein
MIPDEHGRYRFRELKDLKYFLKNGPRFIQIDRDLPNKSDRERNEILEDF